MSASKRRPRWSDLPAAVRDDVERLVGGRVVAARNCAGGFSPGLASRLGLDTGKSVFVKAMDADAWPAEAVTHRTEARVVAALPADVPAPRLLGTLDDGHWVVLAFEDIDGAVHPSTPADFARVLAAADRLAAVHPALPVDHPRLGGWDVVARDPDRLRPHSAWAVEHLDRLVELEAEGLAAARGTALVHFDLYPHNVLLTPDRVVFVDWPHARAGAPGVDQVIVLAGAAADGVDPEPLLPAVHLGILAADAGFLLAGALAPAPPGLAPIAAEKLRLGLAALSWLRRRAGR